MHIIASLKSRWSAIRWHADLLAEQDERPSRAFRGEMALYYASRRCKSSQWSNLCLADARRMPRQMMRVLVLQGRRKSKKGLVYENCAPELFNKEMGNPFASLRVSALQNCRSDNFARLVRPMNAIRGEVSTFRKATQHF